MKKRLLCLVLTLLLLTAPLALAKSQLEMLPGNFRGDLGTDAISFYRAYSTLCDAMFSKNSTETSRDYPQEGYAVDTYVREGMSDVQVLFRLSDMKVISVGCRMNEDASQSQSSIYKAGLTYGKTVPTLLITLAYLDLGEDMTKLQKLMPSITKITNDFSSSFQSFSGSLSSSEPSQTLNTLPYEKWYLSNEFIWDSKNLITISVIHAEPL